MDKFKGLIGIIALFSMSSNAVFCQCDTFLSLEMILGKWYPSPLIEEYTCYNKDSTFNTFYYGEYSKVATGLSNVDTISPWEIGEKGFHLSCNGDTLMFNSYYLKNYKKDTSISYILSLTEKELISVTYKKLNGLRDRIDGVGISYRNPLTNGFISVIHAQNQEFKTRFVLKPGFQGYVVVVYGAGIDFKNGSSHKKLRVHHIPSNGLLETNENVDPIAFIRQDFEFYYENNTITKLPIIHRNVRSFGLAHSTLVREYLSHFNEDSICVMPFGYNQFARSMLNEKFGKSLQGNAEIYYVGPLRNVIGKFPQLFDK